MAELAARNTSPTLIGNQLLGFESQGRRYACDLLWVKEILRSPLVTPVRLAPPYVRGVVHLRGQILTVLDLETRLGHSPRDPAPVARCIVFKTSSDIARLYRPPADAEMADTDPVGLLVDSIGDILPPDTPVLPPPPEALSRLDSRLIEGVVGGTGELVTVLRIGALLSVLEARKASAP